MSDESIPKKKNKILTIIGYLLVTAALFYLIHFFLNLDFSQYTIWDNPMLIPFTIISSIVYGGVLLLVIGISLKLSINMMSEKKIDIVSSLIIAGNTNIAKYIPGNVFHFVGRVILGKRVGLGNIEVTLSIFLEVFCVAIASVTPVIIMVVFNLIAIPKEILDQVDINKIILIGSLAAVFLLGGLIILYRIKRKKIIQLIQVIKRNGIVGFLLYIAKEDILYTGLLIFQGILFYIALGMFYPQSLSEPNIIFPIIGVSIIGWFFGFIIPGAPGGFGVRETIVVVCLSLYTDDGALLLASFLTRLVFILGDVTAFLFALLVKRIAKPIDFPQIKNPA